MAEVAATYEQADDGKAGGKATGAFIVTWGPLANGDTGSWERFAAYPDKSIHVYGTFGAATVTIQGTNETGTPAQTPTLNDPQGNALTYTSERLEQLLENVNQIRPSVAGGGGTTSLTVKMLVQTVARR